MTKKFKLKNLDCANCAAKIETAISKLEGVNSASVSFMLQRLTLDADESRFDEIVRQADRICGRVEPGCAIQI